MTTTFPLSASRHKGADDLPPGPDTWAIFDARGYWARIGGYDYEQPADEPTSRRNVETVTKMLNAAYEQGRSDKLREIQAVLGIERSDEI